MVNWYDKLKVGDTVELLENVINVGVEYEDVGKVGEIRCIYHMGRRAGICVKMQELCKARGCVPTWNVGYTMIRLVHKKGEQLLFNFMSQIRR